MKGFLVLFFMLTLSLTTYASEKAYVAKCEENVTILKNIYELLSKQEDYAFDGILKGRFDAFNESFPGTYKCEGPLFLGLSRLYSRGICLHIEYRYRHNLKGLKDVIDGDEELYNEVNILVTSSFLKLITFNILASNL